MRSERAQLIQRALASKEDAWDMNGCVKLINQFVDARGSRRSKKSIEKSIQEAEQKGDQELLNKLLVKKQQMAVSKHKQKMSILYRK